MSWKDASQTGQSEVLPLASVILAHPRQAFASRERIARDWRRLGYTDRPDYDLALAEYEGFLRLLRDAGAELHFLSDDDATTLDSLYARDASIVTDRGLVLGRMGKPERRGEPQRHADLSARLEVPVLGRIKAPATLEGGDVAWLDSRTLAVGHTYRSNPAGLAQLASMLDAEVEILRLEAPHWRGPADVFHLMSVLSPLTERRLLVYSPLLSIAFREALLARGFELLETPEEEFESLGCNCLALGPGTVIIVAGNPQTRARLERAGIAVEEFSGQEICLKGAGGPTCLTRPLLRGTREAY